MGPMRPATLASWLPGVPPGSAAGAVGELRDATWTEAGGDDGAPGWRAEATSQRRCSSTAAALQQHLARLRTPVHAGGGDFDQIIHGCSPMEGLDERGLSGVSAGCAPCHRAVTPEADGTAPSKAATGFRAAHPPRFRPRHDIRYLMSV